MAANHNKSNKRVDKTSGSIQAVLNCGQHEVSSADSPVC